MATPALLLVVNAMVAGAVVIAVLYTLAVFVQCSIELHQLRIETHKLRDAYLRRLAAIRAGGTGGPEVIEVEILGQGEEPDPADLPDAAPQAAAA